MFRLPGLTRCSGTRGIFGTSSGKTLHSDGAAGFTLPAGVLKLAPWEGGSRAAGQGTQDLGVAGVFLAFLALHREFLCAQVPISSGKPSGAVGGRMGASAVRGL